MAVLLYQLVIVASLIFLRFFGGKALLIGAVVWSALSIFNLFAPPLIALQLAVVWITFSVLAPRAQSAPRGAAVSKGSISTPEMRSPISIQTSSDLGTPATSFVEPGEPSGWGAAERVLDPSVGGPLLKQRAMFDLERALTAYFMGRATEHQKHQAFFQMADAVMKEKYYAEWGRLAPQASLSAQPVSLYGEFDYERNEPPTASEPNLQDLLDDRWTSAKAVQDLFISETSRKLNADPMLRWGFMESALLNGAGSILNRLDLKPVDEFKTSDRIKKWFADSADLPTAPRLEAATLPVVACPHWVIRFQC